MRPRVTLYTRKGCCLCDTAKAVIAKARARVDFDYEEWDIDANADLRRLYNEEVPVIAINGVNVFRYGVDPEEFVRRVSRPPNSA